MCFSFIFLKSPFSEYCDTNYLLLKLFTKMTVFSLFKLVIVNKSNFYRKDLSTLRERPKNLLHHNTEVSSFSLFPSLPRKISGHLHSPQGGPRRRDGRRFYSSLFSQSERGLTVS